MWRLYQATLIMTRSASSHFPSEANQNYPAPLAYPSRKSSKVFVLRLFNDAAAQFFCYAALLLFLWSFSDLY